MVQVRTTAPRRADGQIDVEAWLGFIIEKRPSSDVRVVRNACILAQLAGEDSPTLTGISCLQQGLSMAEILLELNLDLDCIAAAIVYDSTQYAELSLNDIAEHLGENVRRLVVGIEQMDAIHTIYSHQGTRNRTHVDNIRKMLLAMVEDVRVVVIKLAERTCTLRAVQNLDKNKQQTLAHEIQDVYAPLANRLGIGQLKWELEDLAFRYLEAGTYKEIAKLVNEKRLDREAYVETVKNALDNLLAGIHISHVDVSGRAKHIYSIYKKMSRKKVGYDQIYDATAFRILVPQVEDCYEVLGAVHSHWKHIQEEFDDYISKPKANGYRSIHTAILGPEDKVVEIQIRTYKMHEESELGVAAHWQYKETQRPQKSSYQAKIAWLRQVLEWQKELAHTDANMAQYLDKGFLEDRVYIFTPAGDIMDLPQGATPLDFAYHVHSEIGNRCRGAKINGNIVPLTYQLKTGEQVEVLTARHASPSRDWLNSQSGHLKTSRAKAKVHHWFKQQDYARHLQEGQELLDKEIKRNHLSLRSHTLEKLAPKLNFRSSKDMLAAIGSGDLRIAQLIHVIQDLQEQDKPPSPEVLFNNKPHAPSSTQYSASDINIHGIDNLLSHIARCCKPVPGDPIVGFITQTRGISIHRYDCPNIKQAHHQKSERLIEVQWGNNIEKTYPVDISIQALNRDGLIRDITGIISNEKVTLLSINSVTNKAENSATVHMTIEVDNAEILSRIMERLQNLPDMIEIRR